MVSDSPRFPSSSPAVPDAVDWEILVELQRDGRLPTEQLSRIVGRDPEEVTERMRRLAIHGIISGYHAVVSLPNVGLRVLAIVHVRHDGPPPKSLDRLIAERREVLECLWISEDNCHILRVAASSMHHLADLVNALSRLGEVSTSVVSTIPLPHRGIAPPSQQPVTSEMAESSMWALS